MSTKDYTRVLEVPDGITIERDRRTITVANGDRKLKRRFQFADILMDVKEGRVVITPLKTRRTILSMVGTLEAHLRNMIHGVQKGFTYELRFVFAHFPMAVKFQGQNMTVTNFLGEKAPRRITLHEGVSGTLDGDRITLTGMDKELVGQAAANLEQLCRRGRKDPRKFQDGIYIFKKGGME